MELFKPELKLEHADKRGEIYSISLPDGKELMLLHSVKGSLRGGHSHDVPETVVVLSGKMRYHKRRKGHDVVLKLRPGMNTTSYNAVGEIHMGEFLEDTWLVEYKWDKQRRQENYGPYRDRVEASAR